MEHLAIGDLIRFKQPGGNLSHVAIYLGDEMVIHLWNPSSSICFSGYTVRIDSIQTVLLANSISTEYVENYTDEYDKNLLENQGIQPLNVIDIISRAKSRLNENRYDVFEWNCEHFVVWARYNTIYSPQLSTSVKEILTSTIVGGICLGPIGALIGGGVSIWYKFSQVISGNPSSGAFLNNTIYNIDSNIITNDKDSLTVKETNIALQMVKEKIECSICTETYMYLPAKVLNCGHIFCSRCLSKLPNRLCPYCRKPIILETKISNKIKDAATNLLGNLLLSPLDFKEGQYIK